MELDHGFRVGRWEIHPSRNSIADGEQAARVEPKVMGVLVELAARPGEVVTRNDLIEKIWRGRIVSDEVLSRCVSLLRSALRDDPKNPQFVQTIPRVGYRLISPVTELEPLTAGTAQTQDIVETSPVSASQHRPVSATAATARQKPPPASTLKILLRELRRRNVFRVAASYVVIGWLLIEASSVVLDLGAPAWVPRVISFLIVLGLPVAVVLSWVYELTPDGLRRERERPRYGPATRVTRRKLDYVIMFGLAFGLAYLIGERLARTQEQVAGISATETPQILAVLPFRNLSADPANEYFSDGLTEDLVNSIAGIEGIRVIASTSSFSFKNSDSDVREIGRALGAGTILSGSVRKDGKRIRISAQLVDASRGLQLWSESYDGMLEDVFEVQDTITTAIVYELQPALQSGVSGEKLARRKPTENLDAYELYLRGRYHLRRRDEEAIRQGIQLFRQAIELDPNFGAAYLQLATAYALLPYYSYELEEDMFLAARATIDQGKLHDARVDIAARGLIAFMNFRSWEWNAAEDNFDIALANAPGDADLHQWQSQFLAAVARPVESLEAALRAKELDALSPVVNDRLAVAYLWNDMDDMANRQFRLADELGLAPSANPEASLVLKLRLGDYQSAREIMTVMQRMLGRNTEWIDSFIAAQGDPDLRPAAIEAVTRAAAASEVSPRYLYGLWLYLGEADRAMDMAFQLLNDPPSFAVEFLFSRENKALREHPRFAELVSAIGLDRYWDQHGWPAFCQRGGDVIRCR
ncbi:MAG: winged helix-turn-helix domain-containing protein [Gammaproteobacteria bacterium]